MFLRFERSHEEPDFAALPGTAVGRLPAAYRKLIAAGKRAYALVTGVGRDAFIAHLLHQAGRLTLSSVVNQARGLCFDGWGESRQSLRNAESAVETPWLTYLCRGLPVQLHQDFVLTDKPEFERRWYEVVCFWFSSKFPYSATLCV